MKTVVITGVGRGIGKALAKHFLDEGFFVVGTSTNGAADFSHENLSLHQLDLSSPSSINACVTEIAHLDKNVDILINNAGVLLDEDCTALVVDKLRSTLEVNLIGTVDFTEQLLPELASPSHLIFVSSTAGSLERAGQAQSHYPMHYPAYKISKAALNMYMRTLALRLKESGVTVSAVHPGWVKTAMGGEDAEITPEESARDIYAFALSNPETGIFWYKGERLPW